MIFGWRRSKVYKELLPTLTTFRGWLRSHRFEQNNIWGQAVFPLAFPGFDPPAWTSEKIDEVRKTISPFVDRVLLQPAQHRRFGGYDLSRGSYYSVAANEDGDDFGTLPSELNAYRNYSAQDIIVTATDGKHFSRLASPGIPDRVRKMKNSSVIVSVYPASRLKSAIEKLPRYSAARLSNPGILTNLTDDNLVDVMLLPKVQYCEIDRIVDLRLPETRRIFSRPFAAVSPRLGKMLNPTIGHMATTFRTLLR